MMKLLRTLAQRMAQRAARVGAIVVVVGAVVVFGHVMTPRQQPALAKVFADLGGVYEHLGGVNAEGMPRFMELEVEEGAVQEVFLNGNTLFYTQYRTDKSITQLLDFYENLYRTDPHVYARPEAKKALLKMAEDSKDIPEHRRQIEETERILNERFIRFEGDGWGGYSTIVSDDPSGENYTNEMIDRFRRFKETGKASELGDPKIVVAFDDSSTGDTQYFNVWPDKEFDHRHIAPRGEDDAPGYDIEDIPRPRQSQRLLTFGQEHGGRSFQILAYKTNGERSGAALEAWYRRLLAQGWSVSPTWEEGKTRTESPVQAGLFIKDQREAYVSVRQHEDGDVTSTVVVHGG